MQIAIGEVLARAKLVIWICVRSKNKKKCFFFLDGTLEGCRDWRIATTYCSKVYRFEYFLIWPVLLYTFTREMQSIGLYVIRIRPLECRAQWATRVNKPCIHLAYIARPSVSSSYFVLIHSSHSSPLYIWNGLRDIHFSWVHIRSFPSSKMAFLFFQWFSENPWIILIHSKKNVILLTSALFFLLPFPEWRK